EASGSCGRGSIVRHDRARRGWLARARSLVLDDRPLLFSSGTIVKLFEPFSLGSLRLQSRVVMAPMTRSRATGNVPNDLMAQYYGQRSGAGLIVTEGTSPSPNGIGYSRIPGAYSAAQTEGWKKV